MQNSDTRLSWYAAYSRDLAEVDEAERRAGTAGQERMVMVVHESGRARDQKKVLGV
jgi:hypothetical protein